MIKMFVSSFYNTLIDEEDAIPTSTMLEIDRIRQKKIKFTIITNRAIEDVLYYNHDYPFIDYIISLNGSLILDVSKNTTKTLKSFTQKELEEISKKYSKKEITYYTIDNSYHEIPNSSVYKVEINGVRKNIESDYQTSIFKRCGESFLEICKNTPYDALRKLNIDNNEIIAVIGNQSDTQLLDKLKEIYVVRNASKELKNKTDKITKSNTKKGVEEVLKKY